MISFDEKWQFGLLITMVYEISMIVLMLGKNVQMYRDRPHGYNLVENGNTKWAIHL
jgi:hypothetical protein